MEVEQVILMKKLDKVQRIEIDAEDNSVMKVRFPLSMQPGRVVVEAENVAKSYGDKQVLNNVNLLIERNSKIAFVGQNGQGKTTLAKMIVGEIPYDGHLKLGHNVLDPFLIGNILDCLSQIIFLFCHPFDKTMPG